ncbi:Rpn family recombination-promoting nuclease/putative transposase [Citrobacter cronae]|uniref:Rpn family recombination-promoting nuclease/putative transposase n=1 Tax=Citrobacter cronae TaxID=1748967 RepID=UPI001900A292|nr:Rpn family recombination-promoting nuclease/putative transposase [Citrobacter cronae]MBJ8361724.1 Rpn family recombination-promoting nuclease/putative transposase [Citrobacter cronae]MBU5385851.1 Rpn family recombination-promoting nuclease/putative transposase [Citrobacter cronae]
MDESTTATPHDAVFKKIMSYPEMARDFLDIHLPPALREMCDLQTLKLARQLYSEAFPLVDITVIPDDEIAQHRRVALLELMQKHIRDRDLMGLVDRLVSLLVTSTANDSQLQTLLNYLLRYGNVSHVSAFIHEVAERSPHHKERLMTIAERLRQEGHHHGLQEGIQQGLEQGVQKGTQEEALRIARMMLENGIDHNLVQLITGLLPGEVTE